MLWGIVSDHARDDLAGRRAIRTLLGDLPQRVVDIMDDIVGRRRANWEAKFLATPQEF